MPTIITAHITNVSKQIARAPGLVHHHSIPAIAVSPSTGDVI